MCYTSASDDEPSGDEPLRDWRTIPCPVERTATLLADHYVMMIVRDLVAGPKRFGDLQRAGINPRTLSARLRLLLREGFVRREPHRERPPRVVYRLTGKGEALLPLIDFLRTYGETWLPVPTRPAASPAPPSRG